MARPSTVTTPLRTCFDLARTLHLVDAVAALDRALYREIVALDDLQADVAGRPRHPGIARERLAIEYDGDNHRDRLVNDNRRQNRLQRAGYTLLRHTAPDVHGRSGAIVEDVRAQLRCARFSAPGGAREEGARHRRSVGQ